MKTRYLVLLCCLFLFWGNVISASDEDIVKSKYKLYLQQIDSIRSSLKLESTAGVLRSLSQMKKDWESQKPVVRKKTNRLMSEILYLETCFLFKSGKRDSVLTFLKRAIAFEKEQKLIFSPLQKDYALFKNVVSSFVNSCHDISEESEVIEYFGRKNIAFSESLSGDRFVAVLFRSNELSREDEEFSIVLLYRKNSQGLYEASELKIPWTKYHTLSLENQTGDSPNIILRKKIRTGEMETITIGIQDGLKIISRDRK